MTAESLSSRRTELALVFLLSAIVCSITTAQRVPLLKAGDRIRVVSQSVPEGEVEGRLINVFRDTLSMVASDSIGFLAIPLDSVGRFEVNRGKSFAPLLAGVVVGAGVGAFLGSMLPASHDRCRAGFADVEDCATEVSDPIIGAVAGAIGLGTLARALTKERWVRIRPDLLLDIDIRPLATTQVVLSVSLRF